LGVPFALTSSDLLDFFVCAFLFKKKKIFRISAYNIIGKVRHIYIEIYNEVAD